MSHFTTYSLSFDNLYHPHCTSLRDYLQLNHPQLQSITLTRSNFSCLTITGNTLDVLTARADIINHYPHEIQLPIDSLCPSMPYRTVAKRKLHKALKIIALKQQVQMVVDYNSLKICLVGLLDRIDKARIEVLLLIDRFANMSVDSIDIPLYYVNIIGNKKYSLVQSVMEETGTNIYIPSLYSLFDGYNTHINHTNTPSNNTNPLLESACTLYVSGDTMKDVQKAIAALNKLMIAKIKSTCNLRSKLNTRKRDWLLIYQQEELTRIMRDNGSFIVFPPFGSDKSDDIYVYAENNLDVERTLRSLNYLTSMLFQVVIYLNSSHIQWVDLFTRLSQSSGTEILFQSDNNQLDITGTKKQVLSIVELLSKHSIIQDHHLSSVFSIELASDQRDFISGKKNGKINKIMKSCEAHIHFKEYNEFNFLIHIQSDDFLKAKKGLDSLQKELPAEISFFVPEICHRRIIGVGGKNIQRVMKQFGVYVKFSSNEEMASSVGYFDVDHNVIARTPEKNIKSLDKLKASIMEFISFQKDRDYISKQEYVPSFAHRKLLHLHGKFLREKGKLYNSKIVWPERNGTDHVLVVGPESHIEEMQLRIRNLLPQSAEVQISSSSALECLLASDRMEELINNIYSTTSIHLILPQPMGPRKNGQHHQSSLLSTSMEPLVRIIDCDTFSFFNNHTSTFKLCYDDNSKHKLDEAKDILNTFISHNSSLSKELSDIPYDDLLTLVDAHHISPSVMHRIDFPESYEYSNAIKKSQYSHIPYSNFDIPKTRDTTTRRNTDFFKADNEHQLNQSLKEFTKDPEEWREYENKLFQLEDIQDSHILFNAERYKSYEYQPNEYSQNTPSYNFSYILNNEHSRSTSSISTNSHSSLLPMPQDKYLYRSPSIQHLGYSRQRSTSLLPLSTQRTYNNLSYSTVNAPKEEMSSFGLNVGYVPFRASTSALPSNNIPHQPFINARLRYSIERNNPSNSYSTPILGANMNTNSAEHSHTYFYN